MPVSTVSGQNSNSLSSIKLDQRLPYSTWEPGDVSWVRAGKGALFLETGVNRLNEHRCGPGSGVRAKARVVVGGDFRRQDLLESRTFADHGLDPIADDGHHVSLFDHLPFIRKAYLPRVVSWHHV